MDCCIGFLIACTRERPLGGEPANDLNQLFGHKTSSRLREYCNTKSLDPDDVWTFNGEFKASLNQMCCDSRERINLDKADWPTSVMHGDFCFSNILYDVRSRRIKTIDPRGITPDGAITLYGDVRYDIAKLSHSIIGMYDWIVAGYFNVDIQDKDIRFEVDMRPIHQEIQKLFIVAVDQHFNISFVELLAMQIQLFLSMLPMHSDDSSRQDALFANAFRLYQLMKGIKE